MFDLLLSEKYVRVEQTFYHLVKFKLAFLFQVTCFEDMTILCALEARFDGLAMGLTIIESSTQSGTTSNNCENFAEELFEGNQRKVLKTVGYVIRITYFNVMFFG